MNEEEARANRQVLLTGEPTRIPIPVRPRTPSAAAPERLNRVVSVDSGVETVSESLTETHLPPRMPTYTNFKQSKARIAEHCSWYRTRDMLKALKEIVKINYSVTESRANALARLNALDTEAPFSETERFAEVDDFITDYSDDWGRRIQQLRMSLSFKGEHSTKKEVKPTESSDFNDSFVAFHNSILAIRSAIRGGSSSYTRASFEDEFRLTWV